jgi:hypothetical protein
MVPLIAQIFFSTGSTQADITDLRSASRRTTCQDIGACADLVA